MYGILVSALNFILSYVFSKSVINYLLLTAFYIVTVWLIGELITYLPSTSILNSMFSKISPTVWYFLNLCAIPQGITMYISAYATRFAIRRIPVIG